MDRKTLHPLSECLSTACTDCLKIYWRYGSGTTTAIWHFHQELAHPPAWNTEPPLNNWSAYKMRCFRSDTFKILTLLEFGCSIRKHHSNQWVKWGHQTPKSDPSAWGTWTPIYYSHAMTSLTHLPKQQLDRCTHLCTTMQQSPHWLQRDAPNSPPKLPIPLRRQPPPSNNPSLNRLCSPSQTVYRSNQPFCHSTLSGQTNRQPERPTDRPTLRLTDGLGNRSET